MSNILSQVLSGPACCPCFGLTIFFRYPCPPLAFVGLDNVSQLCSSLMTLNLACFVVAEVESNSPLISQRGGLSSLWVPMKETGLTGEGVLLQGSSAGQHLQVRPWVLCWKTVCCSPRAGSESLPHVKRFKYRGVLFTSNGKMEHEINRRIGIMSAALS